MTNDMDDDRLVSYLLGEASVAEREDVEQWINASAANKKYFEDLKLIWDQSKLLAATSTVNEHEAWGRLLARAQQDEPVGTQAGSTTRTIPLFRRSWVRLAAMLVLFLGIGAVIYTRSGMEQLVARSGNGTLTETLPDGSVVVLNKNSSISYPSRFEGNKRSVTLTGEAFFTVTHDKTKPFIITANNAAVTVVGTSFNVKTSDVRTEVIVETGIVQVAKKDRAVRVMPNQRAIVEIDKDAPVKDTTTDELYNYYRTKEFKCNGTPLRKLVVVLNEAYDVHIVFADDKLGDEQLSAKFKDEPLDNILKVISETHGIKVARKGGDIMLKRADK